MAEIAGHKSKGAGHLLTMRFWIATVAVVILVIAVWKFIDFRMQPPPPGEPTATATKP